MGENNQPIKPPRRKISRSTAGDCNETIELEPIETFSVSFVYLKKICFEKLIYFFLLIY